MQRTCHVMCCTCCNRQAASLLGAPIMMVSIFFSLCALAFMLSHYMATGAAQSTYLARSVSAEAETT